MSKYYVIIKEQMDEYTTRERTAYVTFKRKYPSESELERLMSKCDYHPHAMITFMQRITR